MAEFRLNRNQYLAVSSNHPRIACIAGPGTGKTRVLVQRVKRLLAEGHSPHEILVLTFTNKAAHEVRERLDSPKITAGTFHSVCYTWINRYLERFGEFRPYVPTIYDDADTTDIVKEVVEKFVFSYSQTKARAILTAKYQDLIPNDEFTQSERLFISAFEEAVINQGHALTYDQILYYVYQKLSTDSFFQREMQQYKYVFVDEYQDTNKIQSELIKQLNPANLFVVGDLDQAIYAWRGAKLQELMNFANEPGTEKIFLNVSYRCRPAILQAAHNLIINNEIGFKEEILPSKEGVENAVQHTTFYNHQDELNSLLVDVASIQDGKTLAVLTRTNREASDVSELFKSKKIDHLLLTSENNLWGDFLVKNLMSYLKLVMNPKNGYSLFRAFREPARDWYNARIKSELHLEALEKIQNIVDVAAVRFPYDIVFKYLETVNEDTPIVDAIQELYNLVKPSNYLPNKQDIFAQLQTRIEEWANKAEDNRLKSFVRWMVFRDMQDALMTENAKVLVMTMHGAKGLEFDSVVIQNCVEGYLPIKNGDIEEERRLMYVAVTRAKDWLMLTDSEMIELPSYPGQVGVRVLNCIPSRFLHEMQIYEKQKA